MARGRRQTIRRDQLPKTAFITGVTGQNCACLAKLLQSFVYVGDGLGVARP